MIAAGQVLHYFEISYPLLQIFHMFSKHYKAFNFSQLLQYASHVPGRPEFPEGAAGDIRNCLAIGSRTKTTVQWFLFRSEDNLV